MKLLVSGAGGFLGRHLLEYMMALEEECHVIALSSNPSALDSHPAIRRLSNEEFLASSCPLNDYTLIHLAFARSSDFDEMKSGIEWTCALLEKYRLLGGKEIVNISSQSVYDPQRYAPAKESDAVKLTSLYDMGKYYVEKWMEDFSKKHHLSFVHLRIGSLVGPGFAQRLPSRLIKRAALEGEISITRSPFLFSYVHVKDMVRAIVSFIECTDPDKWGRIYNVGSEETYTMQEIARTIERALLEKGRKLILHERDEGERIGSSAVDSTLFRACTGWKPEYLLEAIIKEELNEYD